MAKTYSVPYAQNPNIGKVTLLNADTSFTTPTTAGAIAITAGVNGTRIDGMKVRALGTNVQTVLRVFLNDGLGTAATNFSLLYEIKLPASTAVATDTTQSSDILILPTNYDNAGSGNIPPYLPSGYKLYVSLGTTVAAGFAITTIGADF